MQTLSAALDALGQQVLPPMVCDIGQTLLQGTELFSFGKRRLLLGLEHLVVMGVPVGTDAYIRASLTTHVSGLLLDIAALDYFTLHGQWTLLRMCVNQRPMYLQRLLQLRHGGDAFARFDTAVTAKVLDIMGVMLRARGFARNASSCMGA